MKIIKIDVLRLIGDDGKDYVFCRVHTNAGIYGDGEVAGICACEGSYGILKNLARRVLGMNPFDTEKIWDMMHRTTFWGQNGGPMTYAGMSAIDIALWDIKGKCLKTPLYNLLGGKTHSRIRSYASQLQLGWFPIYSQSKHKPAATLQDYREVCQAAINEGYDAVKVDIFTYNEQGTRFDTFERRNILRKEKVDLVRSRVKVIRETIGPNVDLIIENHARMDIPGAIQVAEAIKEFNIMYFEEPNTPAPHTAKVLAEKISIPIAGGERIYSKWQYVPYLQDQSIRVIQPDLGNGGGYTEVLKLCAMAQAYEAGVQLHTCGSPLSTSIALHLEAALPNFVIHEHHKRCRTLWVKGLTKYNPQPVDGYLEVPEEPGIGNEFTDLAYERAVEFEVVQ